MPTPPFPSLDALDERQRSIYRAIAAGPRGKVEGPLLMWLTSPDLADAAQRLGEHCRYGTGIPGRLSELAILVTASFWRSGFEWHVHAPIALERGVAPSIVEALRTGGEPTFDDPAEKLVHRFASELWHQKCLSASTRAAAIDMFGPRSVVELVGLLGYYGLISMTINAFDIPTPDGSDPFMPGA